MLQEWAGLGWDVSDRTTGPEELRQDSAGLESAILSETSPAPPPGNLSGIRTSLLLDLVPTIDARQVYESGLHDARLALDGLHDALSEAEASVRHAESRGAGAVFGFHHLVAAELDA